MRTLSFAFATAVLLAATIVAIEPAAAQQCPKGKSFDYASQSCK
jgi:hypothetical protein